MCNDKRLAVSLVLALAWVLTSLPVATAANYTVTGYTVDQNDGSTPVGSVLVVVMNSNWQELKRTTSDSSSGQFTVPFSSTGGPGQPIALLDDGRIIIQVTRPNGRYSSNIYGLSGLTSTTLNPVVP